MYRVTSQTATSTTAAPSGNLFSALPSAPEMSTGLCCTISSVQYGISSLPVCSIFSDQSFLPYCWARMHVSCSKCFFVCLVAKVGDRSAPSRGSLSVPRHLSQRRVRLPLRRYHTKTDAPKVENRSFFSSLRITSKSRKENVNWCLFFSSNQIILFLQVAFDTQRQEALYAPKLDAFVIPRQNPRKVTVTDPAIVNNDDWLGDEVCDKLPNHLESHLPVPNSPTNQNGI